MYQALYRKWRPMTFEEVIGQEHITVTLKSQLVSGRLSHAYLFTGTRGTGKTTCAKILARAANCEAPVSGDPCNRCAACRAILSDSVLDVLEIDAATNNGVDHIRQIREDAQYAPASVRMRVYIVDEVHMLSTGAFNALLKTLEEPPDHVLFILATTEVHKIPATILSRCQRFDFRRISADEMADRLLLVAEGEGFSMEREAAVLVAHLGDGSMRDALSILERCASGQEALTAGMVRAALGLADGGTVLSLMRAISSGGLAEMLEIFSAAYANGMDLAALFDEMLSVVRDLMIAKTAPDGAESFISPKYETQQVMALAESLNTARLMSWIGILRDGQVRLRQGGDRRMTAEMCLIMLCSEGVYSQSAAEKVPAPASKKTETTPATNKTSSVAKLPERAPVCETPPLAARPPSEENAQDFSATWADIIRLASKSLPKATQIHLALCEAKRDGQAVVIHAEDEMTAMMVDKPEVKQAVEQAAGEVLGYSAPVRFQRDQKNRNENTAIMRALEAAKKSGVGVTIKE